MQNVTFRLDERTLRRARIRALEEGTSLNAVVERLLATWSSREAMDARHRLTALARRHATDARLEDQGGTRDDLYEERTQWPPS